MGVYGTGSIFKRGKIWYVSYFDGENTRMQSTRSERKADAVKLREKILRTKMSGMMPDSKASRMTCGELLDDVLVHVAATGKASTAKIWGYVINGSGDGEKKKDGALRKFFGDRRAAAVTTETIRAYRESRLDAGRSDSTVNRELSILRTAFHQGRKSTPSKVSNVPYFPMTSETGNARQGFLTDEQYTALRDALPDYLKPLFVVAYFTGIRKGELLAIRWEQVDFAKGFIHLRADETKGEASRAVPIFDGDMRSELLAAANSGRSGEERGNGESHPQSHELVFGRDGKGIKDFRGAWETAIKAAGVAELKFHDLRRTAVRNLRRAGVPQVVRMKISGHKTISMEQRYNIVDTDDLEVAKTLMARKNS